MNLHVVTEKIQELLKQNGFWFETFEHEPVRTSEEAANLRTGYTLKQGAKSIILRVKIAGGDKYYIMLVVPGDKRFNDEKVKKILEAKDIRFATDEEVKKITDGIEPGGIPPFGELFNIKSIVDPSIFDNEKIVFNAGDRRVSIGMISDDYRKLAKPYVIDII